MTQQQELMIVDTGLTTRATINQTMLNDFIAFLDVRPASVRTYKQSLKRFFEWLVTAGISEPTRQDIISYRQHLKTICKPTTTQNYIIAIKQFFRWTAQNGIYENIADNIKGAKLDTAHKKDALTAKQIKQVLRAIKRNTEQEKRDYAIILIMAISGLRTIEISRANIEDVRTIGDTTVLYIQGKGKDERTDFIRLRNAEKHLRDYINSRGKPSPKEPLFTSTSNNNKGKRMTTRSISGIVKEAFLKVGLNSDRLTAHSLRHTAGTLNLLAGGTLQETKNLLRHQNITTTEIYTHNIDNINNKSEERIYNAIFGN